MPPNDESTIDIQAEFSEFLSVTFYVQELDAHERSCLEMAFLAGFLLADAVKEFDLHQQATDRVKQLAAQE